MLLVGSISGCNIASTIYAIYISTVIPFIVEERVIEILLREKETKQSDMHPKQSSEFRGKKTLSP